MKDAQDLPKPSEEFERAFTSSGSIVVECNCGRTHFCDREDAGDFEVGELEGLREANRKSPDKVMGWDCTSIGRIQVDGKEFAEGCPCHAVTRYERWIWDHRAGITEYLFARLRRILEDAKGEVASLTVAGKLMGLDEEVRDIEDAIGRLHKAAVPKAR